jgi:hypothetical protein
MCQKTEMPSNHSTSETSERKAKLFPILGISLNTMNEGEKNHFLFDFLQNK